MDDGTYNSIGKRRVFLMRESRTMKKAIALTALLLVPLVVMAGPKAVKDFTGSKTITLIGADRDTVNVNVQVSDIINEYIWDRMLGVIRIPNLTVDDDTAVGNIDTCIVIMQMVAGHRRDTLSVDTVFPGDSGYLKYDFYRQDQTLDTLKDSAGVVNNAVYYENVDWLSLALDQMEFNVVFADSAGSEDTTGVTLEYWFRFFDED